MTLDENSSSVISLDEAQTYVKSFKERYTHEPVAFFAGSEKINLILEQDNCVGIRIYNGFDSEENRRNLVLVGVDKNQKDMTHGIILEKLIVCPTFCDLTSALFFNEIT